MGRGGLRHLEPEVPEGDVDYDDDIHSMLQGAGLSHLIGGMPEHQRRKEITDNPTKHTVGSRPYYMSMIAKRGHSMGKELFKMTKAELKDLWEGDDTKDLEPIPYTPELMGEPVPDYKPVVTSVGPVALKKKGLYASTPDLPMADWRDHYKAKGRGAPKMCGV
jgi:hypothetical protein